MAEKSSLKVSRSVLGRLGPNGLTSPPAPGNSFPPLEYLLKMSPAVQEKQMQVVLSQRTGITRMCGRLKRAPCPQRNITQP